MTLKMLITRSRRCLHFYSAAARSLGWFLTAMGLLGLSYTCWLILSGRIVPDVIPMGFTITFSDLVSYIAMPISHALLPGLLALATAQLLRFSIDREAHPRRLLRHADILFYCLAAYCLSQLVSTLPASLLMTTGGPAEHFDLTASLLGLVQLSGELAIIITAIGFGYALRRVLPIIEESKALV